MGAFIRFVLHLLLEIAFQLHGLENFYLSEVGKEVRALHHNMESLNLRGIVASEKTNLHVPIVLYAHLIRMPTPRFSLALPK